MRVSEVMIRNPVIVDSTISVRGVSKIDGGDKDLLDHPTRNERPVGIVTKWN